MPRSVAPIDRHSHETPSAPQRRHTLDLAPSPRPAQISSEGSPSFRPVAGGRFQQFRGYTDSYIYSEWDSAIRRERKEDEALTPEVDRALRYQKRAHLRRDSVDGSVPPSPISQKTKAPASNGQSSRGCTLPTTPTTPGLLSPLHSPLPESPKPMTPLELHKLEFPREPRIHYPVPPSQWDDEEEIAPRPRRFSSPQLWLDLVETFKRDHLSLPVERKPKASRPPLRKHSIASPSSAFPRIDVATSPRTEGDAEVEVILETRSRGHRHHRRSSSLRDTIVKRITRII